MSNQLGTNHAIYHPVVKCILYNILSFKNSEYFNGVSPKALTIANGSSSIDCSTDGALKSIVSSVLLNSAVGFFMERYWYKSTKPLTPLLQKNIIKSSCLYLPAAIVKIAFFSIAHRLENKTNGKPRMDTKIGKRVERTIYIISTLTLSVFVMPRLYSKLKGKTYNINTTGMVKYFAIQVVIHVTIAECFAYHGNLMRDSLKNNPNPWIDYFLNSGGNLFNLGYGLERSLLKRLQPCSIQIANNERAKHWLAYYNKHTEDFSGLTNIEAPLFAKFIIFGLEDVPPLTNEHLATLTPADIQIDNLEHAQAWFVYYNDHTEDFSECAELKDHLTENSLNLI